MFDRGRKRSGKGQIFYFDAENFWFHCNTSCFCIIKNFFSLRKLRYNVFTVLTTVGNKISISKPSKCKSTVIVRLNTHWFSVSVTHGSKKKRVLGFYEALLNRISIVKYRCALACLSGMVSSQHITNWVRVPRLDYLRLVRHSKARKKRIIALLLNLPYWLSSSYCSLASIEK